MSELRAEYDDAEVRSAIIRGLEARFKAVLAECELAEAEARHVVDDEVYVSVGLIRNALNTPTPPPQDVAETSAADGASGGVVLDGPSFGDYWPTEDGR